MSTNTSNSLISNTSIINDCNMNYPYCFISYSSIDNSTVFSIVEQLNEKGYNIWIDFELEKHIGDEWDRVVETVILNKNCKCILWFVSSNSCKSINVVHELEWANSSNVFNSHNQNKVKIYPIEIEEIITNNNIKAFIQNLKSITRNKDHLKALKRMDNLILDNKIKRLNFTQAFLPSGINNLTESLKSDGFQDVIENPVFKLFKDYSEPFLNDTNNDTYNKFIGNFDSDLLPKFIDNDNNINEVKNIIDFNKADKLRVILIGEGGSGKTTSLFQILKKLNEKNFVSIYIPLNQISDNLTIFEYAKFQLNPNNSTCPDYLDKFLKSNQMVYLLDGLNEINPQKEWFVKNQISALSNFDSHILITSRHNTNLQPLYKEIYNNFKLYNIIPISDVTIKEYLKKCGVEVPTRIPKVITSPLMLKMYISLKKEGLHLKLPNEAALIWKYLQYEIDKMRFQDNKSYYNTFFAFFYLAPYLAWSMSCDHSMYLSSLDLNKSINNAKDFYNHCLNNISNMNRDINKDFFENQILYQNNDIINYENIFNILVKQGLILQDINGTIKFFHQSFRDCLTAIHCLNEIQLFPLKDVEALSKNILSKDVLIYIADLNIGVVKNYWKKLDDDFKSELNSCTRMNLIFLFNEYYNGKLGKISFKNKDLRGVSLNSFIFVDDGKHSSFRNAKINKQTFAPPITHNCNISYITSSLDFRYIISGDNSGMVIIYDTERARPILNKNFLNYSIPIKSIFIVENYLFVCYENCCIFRFDFSNGSFDNQITFFSANEEMSLIDIAYSLENVFVLIDDTLYCINILSSEKTKIEIETNNISCLSVDFYKLYIYCGTKNGIIYKIDCKDGEIIDYIDISDYCKQIIKICSYSDEYIYIIDEEGKIICLNFDIGLINKNFKWDNTNGHSVGNICITPNGKHIISTSTDGNLIRCNSETGKIEYFYKFSGSKGVIHNICISADGKYIVSDCENNTPIIRGIFEKDIPYGDFYSAVSREIVAINVSNNGKKGLIHSRLAHGIETIIWNFEEGKPVFIPINTISLWKSNTKSITNDGNILFFGQGEKLGYLNLLNKNELEMKTYEPFKGWMYSIMIDERNKTAWIGSNDKRIYRFNIFDGSLIDISSKFEDTINCFSINTSGKIYAGDWNGRIYQLDEYMNIISSFVWNDYREWINDIEYDEISKSVYVGLDSGYIIKLNDGLKKVILYWKYTGKHRWDKPGIVSLTIDKEKIIALSNDNCIFIINKDTFKLEKKIDLRITFNSIFFVRTVKQIKHSNKIIVGGNNGDAYLFDVENEKIIKKYHRIKNICLVGCDFRGVDFKNMELLREELKESGAIVDE